MSLVFEALENLKAERNGVLQGIQPEVRDLIESVGEGRIGARRGAARRAAEVGSAKTPRAGSTTAGRTLAVMGVALPMVRKALNLIGGRKGGAVARPLAPMSAAVSKPDVAAVAATPAQTDLTAIADGLAAIKKQSSELRVQVVEQNASLLRIETHLEMVREATHRNTLEQKETIEDLRGVGRRINLVAAIGLGLLVASVASELLLYLRIIKVL